MIKGVRAREKCCSGGGGGGGWSVGLGRVLVVVVGVSSMVEGERAGLAVSLFSPCYRSTVSQVSSEAKTLN